MGNEDELSCCTSVVFQEISEIEIAAADHKVRLIVVGLWSTKNFKLKAHFVTNPINYSYPVYPVAEERVGLSEKGALDHIILTGISTSI